MKIALLTDGIHPYVIGGMQKHSLQLARYFAQNKHTVYLFHCNESNYNIDKLEFFSDEEKQYIKSYVIPFPHKKYFPFHYIYESFEYSKLIRQSLKNILDEVDFIYAQGFCAWDLLRNKENSKLPPIAVHFHGLNMFQVVSSFKEDVSKYFLRKIVKFNLKKADYCISYGGKINDILTLIVSKEKIWEVPAGIENSWFRENSGRREIIQFVFIGRYEKIKGISELNSAIENLLPSGGFLFDFIGPIPEKYKINSPMIKYHGKVSIESKIQNILTQADVLVCPSYSEGMPNVIMEAMACGLAIIATDVGAVSLLVNSDNGWLLESPKATHIITFMKQALEAKGEYIEQKKQNSVRKIKHFLIENILHELSQKIELSIKKVSSHTTDHN